MVSLRCRKGSSSIRSMLPAPDSTSSSTPVRSMDLSSRVCSSAPGITSSIGMVRSVPCSPGSAGSARSRSSSARSGFPGCIETGGRIRAPSNSSGWRSICARTGPSDSIWNRLRCCESRSFRPRKARFDSSSPSIT